MDGGVGNYAANEPRNLPKATMERKAKKSCHRAQTEVCFVRNLELLHDDELRLVMRDKLAPLVVGGGDSLTGDAYAVVRLAHSDEALAVMFEVEATDCVGTMTFALRWSAGECQVELRSDGEQAWCEGVSDKCALRHFGAADNKHWWRVAVLPLAAIALPNNTAGIEADFTIAAVGASAAEQQAHFDLSVHCTANLV